MVSNFNIHIISTLGLNGINHLTKLNLKHEAHVIYYQMCLDYTCECFSNT